MTQIDTEQLERLYEALSLFRLLNNKMPLQYVLSFLAVATDEGKGVTEYAQKMGFSLTTTSRHLLDIGPRNRNMHKGYGLVDYRQNPQELRKHEYFLTPKGKRLLAAILRELNGSSCHNRGLAHHWGRH